MTGNVCLTASGTAAFGPMRYSTGADGGLDVNSRGSGKRKVSGTENGFLPPMYTTSVSDTLCLPKSDVDSLCALGRGNRRSLQGDSPVPSQGYYHHTILTKSCFSRWSLDSCNQLPVLHPRRSFRRSDSG